MPLGGFFIFAALPKIADPTLFALQIGDYQLLSDPWPTVMAVSMPWLELLVGVAIVVRKLYLGSLLTVIGMLVAFMIALSTLIVRNLDVECGCFGSGGTAPEAMARGRHSVGDRDWVGRAELEARPCRCLVWKGEAEGLHSN